MKTKKKLFKRILIGLSTVIVIFIGGFLLYVNDYYRASEEVTTIIDAYDGIIQQKGSYTIIYPKPSTDQAIGFVFYPGGKVEAKAYMPLLIQLSEQGVTSILVDMPFNLAVFDVNAADQAIKLVPEIEEWYLSGHSLGGAMASSYIQDNISKFKGLVLLSAYPINEADIPTIQIYGSNDQVLDLEKIVDSVPVVEISGGNHAYFGNYGNQANDGEASITQNEQQQQTIQQILEFMNIEKID